MGLSFADLLKLHFKYLTDDYGFVVAHEIYSPMVMGNASVDFESSKTRIEIVLDRSQVLIALGPVSWPRHEWFEFSDVVRFFAPAVDPIYVFPEDIPDHAAALEMQVSRLANPMRQHCDPVLRGDFSMCDGIKEVERKREAELHQDLDRIADRSKGRLSDQDEGGG